MADSRNSGGDLPGAAEVEATVGGVALWRYKHIKMASTRTSTSARARASKRARAQGWPRDGQKKIANDVGAGAALDCVLWHRRSDMAASFPAPRGDKILCLLPLCYLRR